jgi:flagellar assembly protein FliH
MSSSEAAGYTFEQFDPSLLISAAAGTLVEPWELERDRVAAQAREEGLALAREQAEPALAALAEAVAGIDALRRELAEQLEREAVDMALALAEQIVGAAVEVAPERVLDVIRGALRRLGERRRVTALVNPADHALVSEMIGELGEEAGGIEHIAVHSDRRIERGGVVVRTEEGEIDAQARTQLARARAVVAAELAGT